MTGGSKLDTKDGASSSAKVSGGMVAFDPTLGADPIFSASTRSEDTQQPQQATSQVTKLLSLHLESTCSAVYCLQAGDHCLVENLHTEMADSIRIITVNCFLQCSKSSGQLYVS